MKQTMELSLQVKLGSIARHSQEMVAPDGHDFDRVSLMVLLEDPEVAEWMASMDSDGLLPVLR